jgi:hypothetical protein
MTTEIMQFKCPSCGHLLGEQEFKHACEVSDSLVNERLERKEKELKIKHERQLQQQQENTLVLYLHQEIEKMQSIDSCWGEKLDG